MAQTLFERLVHGKTKPEETIYNPLEARVGNRFRIDKIEFRSQTPYVLRGLSEYTRSTNGKEHKFTDYLFDNFRLRIIPGEKKQFSCYLLREDGREGWIPELYEDLNSSSGEFNIHQNGATEKFFRFLSEGEQIPGSPHRAVERILLDENDDGKIQDSEISSFDIEYFDFYRELLDEIGYKYQEFLFVEHNLQDKTFLFLRGAEAIPENVICL